MRVCGLARAYDLFVGRTILVEHDGELRPMRVETVTGERDNPMLTVTLTNGDGSGARTVQLVADGDVIMLREPAE